MSKCIKNMFPSKVDLTKDECRGVLRRLELEAYSSVVSTFRAQGSLDSSKQGVLDQLRRCFHISEDRHKAEVRRVANNEKLTTISELINGKTFDLEWIREGHRSYPLISRAPAYTALHMLADHASKFASQENLDLPEPADTKRERNLDVEITGKPIILDDPTKPSTTTPAIFGISRKDLKRSIDLVTLHPHTKKKHYHHLKPPPVPNMKIQHLYQTLNTKRSRKTFTKKSKTKNSKQSPNRMQFSYPTSLSSSDEKHFDELQRHLTAQLMPPPPLKLCFNQQQPLPTNNKKDMNLLKMNHQTLEPQPHYIPNNRVKNELLPEQQHVAPTGSSRRSKSMNVPSKSNYNSKYSANGAGSRVNSSNNNNNMDHIPDPQIIFNTMSSTNMNMNMNIKMEPSSVVESMPLENSDNELSPAMTSPLQLLSTAASCTPKLKVTSPVNNPQQSITQPSTSSVAQLPSLTTSTPNSSLKVIQNRAIKIIPASTKPIINKPQNPEVVKTVSPSSSQSQQTLVSPTTTPSKFKIQKIQLVMNKNQDGSTTANLSPSATIVSGKAGQLVLSGKSITNTYQVGTKSPYTILSSGTKVGNGPKVIVQTIDRTFAQQQQQQQQKDTQSTTTDTMTSNERIPDNQRITESTPIDFLPVSTTSVPATSFPKVIIQKSVTAPKQIKLKLGPGSIVNSKILKGPLPSNLKIQRNINTKGFTVVNTSQIVQIQSTPTQITTPTLATIESTKLSKETTDWEQELDDANRTKENKERAESNGSGTTAKKPRLDDSSESIQEIVQNSNENIIIESSEIDSSSNIIYAENIPQVDAEKQQIPTPDISEFVFIHTDEEIKSPQPSDSQVQEIINGDDDSTKLNGQFEEVQLQEEEIRTHNGAEAYENLVRSLEADCESESIKEFNDDIQIEENYGFIDGNILDSSNAFTRESERLYQ
ncbi:BRCA2-interacting transcriptional repressor EMSY [Chironomus tepperi]|uniref:BRCA2-interacting transcriptional repressor EMSY n=1 Tax=Chironomus tepperi TaxID=113505 RepID=UPI00391F036A